MSDARFQSPALSPKIADALSTLRSLAAVFSPPPHRCICHIDLDCFYAQVERQRLHVDPAVPFVVQQWQGLIAVNYPARKYGVTRLQDNITTARDKCPCLHVGHVATYAAGDTAPRYYPPSAISRSSHKVSLEPYRVASRGVLEALQRYADFSEQHGPCPAPPDNDDEKTATELLPPPPPPANPDDEIPSEPPPAPPVRHCCSRGKVTIEKGGIDEVFLDVTAPARHLAAAWTPDERATACLRLIDHTRLLTPGFGAAAEELTAIGAEGCAPAVDDAEDPDAARCAPHEETALQRSNRLSLQRFQSEAKLLWLLSSSAGSVAVNDLVLFAAACEVVEEARSYVRTATGFDMSGGVTKNRSLAKIISATNKPNQQTLLMPAHTRQFAGTLPFRDLRGLGGKLGSQIAAHFQAQLCSELWDASVEQLQRAVGGSRETAVWLYDLVRGDGSAEVEQQLAVLPKSMMAQKAFEPPAGTSEGLRRWADVLGTELENRIIAVRQHFNSAPTRLSVKLGKEGMSFTNFASRTVDMPSPATAGQIAAVTTRVAHSLMLAHPGVAVNLLTVVGTVLKTSGAPSIAGVINAAKGRSHMATLDGFFKKGPPVKAEAQEEQERVVLSIASDAPELSPLSAADGPPPAIAVRAATPPRTPVRSPFETPEKLIGQRSRLGRVPLATDSPDSFFHRGKRSRDATPTPTRTPLLRSPRGRNIEEEIDTAQPHVSAPLPDPLPGGGCTVQDPITIQTQPPAVQCIPFTPEDPDHLPDPEQAHDHGQDPDAPCPVDNAAVVTAASSEQVSPQRQAVGQKEHAVSCVSSSDSDDDVLCVSPDPARAVAPRSTTKEKGRVAAPPRAAASKKAPPRAPEGSGPSVTVEAGQTTLRLGNSGGRSTLTLLRTAQGPPPPAQPQAQRRGAAEGRALPHETVVIDDDAIEL